MNDVQPAQIVRRIHLFAALFMMPWLLMYALSTIVMNHHDFFRLSDDGFQTESEQLIRIPFDDRTKTAEQIMKTLRIEETFDVQKQSGSNRLVILTRNPFIPRRITYIPGEGRLVVQRRSFHFASFLARLHQRAGFHHADRRENAWAFSVDLTIVAIVFWCLSGLWMFYELRATHRWGILCLLTGGSLFIFFLIAI